MAFCSNCGKEMSSGTVRCPACGTPGPGYGPRATPRVDARPYAGWWSRVGAAILDGLILGIPYLVVRFATTPDPMDTSRVAERAWQLVGIAVSFLYFMLLEGGPQGQTIGKRVLGIAVRDVEGEYPIGHGRAFVRWLVEMLLSATIVVGIISDLLPLWDTKRQTLHDKAARSVVVRVP